jgi:hypothetical protein
MEELHARGSMSGVAKGYLSIGLFGTQQYQRAVDEGDRFRTVAPLYELGREEEAYTLARSFAADGYPDDLFYLYLRDDREQALVDYVEERWPSVEMFAEENVGNEYGYGAISNLALAYHRLGDQQRFSASIATLERHISKMLEQGISNGTLSVSIAFQQAMQGDLDAAFEELQAAVEKGYSRPGVPTELEPHFLLLADDPRWVGIEETMRENLNRNRAVVGLAPLDATYQAVIE